MPSLNKLPTFSEDGDVHVVIETPRGSRAKLAYDPKLETFALTKSLLTGLTYPHDWGFVPSTKAGDGDPLDIMVIHDAATFPGLVLTCRIIGVLQIEQKSKRRKSGTTACSRYPGVHTRSEASATYATSPGRSRTNWKNSSSQPMSLRTRSWKSSAGRVPRSLSRRSGTPRSHSPKTGRKGRGPPQSRHLPDRRCVNAPSPSSTS
jgi:hypothetical protein